MMQPRRYWRNCLDDICTQIRKQKRDLGRVCFRGSLPTGQKNKLILVFVEFPAQHPTILHFGGGATFIQLERFCSSGE